MPTRVLSSAMLCHKIGKLVPVFQMNMLLPFLNLKIEAACFATTLIHSVASQKTVIFLKCEVMWSFGDGILPLGLLSFWSLSIIYCSKRKNKNIKVNTFWTFGVFPSGREVGRHFCSSTH
jgi:hypothetical protein